MTDREDETRLPCALCQTEGGETTLNETADGKYSAVRVLCWLCEGLGSITARRFARWVRLGRPKEKPAAW